MRKKLMNICRLMLVAMLLAPVCGACKKDSVADAGDLLKKVPSDASAVMVINGSKVLDDLGCENDGPKIKASNEVLSLVDKISNENDRELTKDLLNSESGIDPSVFVCFIEGARTYVTGVVVDPEKFTKFVEKASKQTFSEQDGLKVCGSVALADNMFWLSPNSGGVSTDDVKRFRVLTESQSFMQNKSADCLVTTDKSATGWGNIASLFTSLGLGFNEMMQMQVAIQTIYEDPTDFLFDIDFDKGEAEAQLTVLNGKGKPAKPSLPTQKIDVKTVEQLGGTGDVLMAIAIPNKLITKMQKDAGSKQPSMFGAYLASLSGVDGTSAIIAGKDRKSMKALISTNGQNLSQLSQFVAMIGGETTIDGKQLIVKNGDVSGKFDVSEVAGELKGAMFGLVSSEQVSFFGQGNDYLCDQAIIKIVPEDGTLELEVKLKTDNKKENYLLWLLKNL